MLTGIAQIEELRRAPDDVFSFDEATNEVSSCSPRLILTPAKALERTVQSLQTEYTLGRAIAHNPYHVAIVRAQLTRNIAAIFPNIREELSSAFSDTIPTHGKGTHLCLRLL